MLLKQLLRSSGRWAKAMQGSIKPIRVGSGSLGRYLEECEDKDKDFAGYLEGRGGGVRYSVMEDGREAEGRGIDGDGLDAMLHGRDPFTGERLRAVRDGQIGCFDIPLNDCKALEVLGVRFADVRAAHRTAQRRGMEAVESYLSTHLLARRQDHGRTRFMKADRLLFAAAEHWTSRDGDPHMHTHLELANVCLADGKWVAVDSLHLFHMYENIRSVYETTVYGDPQLRAVLASHGASISLRGGIPQLAEGADDVFSKRRDEINRRLAELVDQWRENNAGGVRPVRDPDGTVVGYAGYADTTEPDRRTMVKLRQQAWADTRKAKGENNTRVDYQAWLRELEDAGYDVDRLLDGHVEPTRLACDVDEADVELCALNAVHALSETRSAWSRNDLEVAAYDRIRDMDATGTRAEIEALADRIMRHAEKLCTGLSDDPRAVLPFVKGLTSRTVIECEADLKGRLAVRGVERSGNLDLGGLADAYSLDRGQRDAVETICKGDPLAVVEGAAGAGKTHMLKAVKRFCDVAGRRLVITTPSRKAAEVAASEVGTDACTVMKLLEAYGYRHDDRSGEWSRVPVGVRDFRGNTYHGVPDEYRLDADTYLVVDEAGMLDQEQARRLLAVADETGANVTLVGDTAQKGAVARGGVLALAKRYTANVADMTDVHRFADPDYAKFTLRLRGHSETTAHALALETLERGMVSTRGSDEATVDAIADEWTRLGGMVVSTATNRQADMVNAAVQARRVKAGQVGMEGLPDMVDGERVHVGDRVMCRFNDNGMRVFNRETYTLEAIGPHGVRLRAKDGSARMVTAGYVREHMQLGYASTTYGAQGVTCGHAVYYAAPGGDGGDMYVALTRGRLSNRVFMTAAGRDEALETLEGIIGRSHGDNGLDEARRALRERIDGISFDQVDEDTMRIDRETMEQDEATPSDRDLLVAAARVLLGTEPDGSREPSVDRDRLERLEATMRGHARRIRTAEARWNEYGQAMRGADEGMAELRTARATHAGLERDRAEALRELDERPETLERYRNALTREPAYRTAMAGMRADADRIDRAMARADGMRRELRGLESLPLPLRALGSARRRDLEDDLDAARHGLRALRAAWTSRWNADVDAIGDPAAMERVAARIAETDLDPRSEAGTLKTRLAGIDEAGRRASELDGRLRESAEDVERLETRHRTAVADAGRLLEKVPGWYRRLDQTGRRAAADEREAIGRALGVHDDAERMERLDGLYRSETGREFEPKPAPARKATEPTPMEPARPRTATKPEPRAARPVPMPATAADPWGGSMLPMPDPAIDPSAPTPGIGGLGI